MYDLSGTMLNLCLHDGDMLQMVPFLLEDKLKELGGEFVREADWAECVVVDGNLVTGQNPGSARKIGEVLVEQLTALKAE